MNDDTDHPLMPVVSAWVEKIRLAHAHKKKLFQNDADEAMQFFNGPYDFLYGASASGKGFVRTGDDNQLPAPSFGMTVNKAAELVQIFGPALYHRNPVRQVNPRKVPLLEIQAFGDPNDPVQGPLVQQAYGQMQMQVQNERAVDRSRSALLEFYLNFTPNSLDLKQESRWAIDEALIKGMGVLWTELYTPPSGDMKMVGSFFDSVDNLLKDPDAENARDVKWIARRCVHPYWQVEQEYGLEKDALKGKATFESHSQQAETTANPDGDYRRAQGSTNDLMVYWRIYSRMGIGGRLKGVKQDLREVSDHYGDNVMLVVAEGVNYPLNLPMKFLETADDQAVQTALDWPTPYWADDSWPCTEIAFHPVPRQIWPMSHLKPAMGELKFINWAYSFLASKIQVSCRDFIAIAKSAGEELKKQITHGRDYTVIEVENLHDSIDKVVKFLQHPDFKKDIYEVIERVTENFEKRVGLTELVYGQTGAQMRSAQEATVKSDQLNVRPDDMANVVEDAMGDLARKEAFAARWHLKGPDVQPVMGELGAQWWEQFVLTSHPQEILHQLEYRIEAGSVRKPNRARDQANAQAAMQNLLPPFVQFAMTGQVGPLNALISFWAKSQDMDAAPFLVQPPPPPMPLPGPPGAGPKPAPPAKKAG